MASFLKEYIELLKLLFIQRFGRFGHGYAKISFDI